MPGCSFQFLGGLKISLEEGVPAAIPGKKIWLLLAYLILDYDMPRSRSQIAFDFWPDSTEKQALSNLRKLIHDLRESIPHIDRYLKITPAYIQWNHEVPCYSDVREFELASQRQTLYELKEAEKLYRGELMPGFYEDWLNARRELLAQLYSHVLEKLISILESRREYSSAALFANKLLAQDRLREENYRTLMRLHALNKNTAGVVQIYQQLCSILNTELGISPAEETVRLFERLTLHGLENSTARHSQIPFIERTDEWEAMLSVWNQAANGKVGMLVLKGGSGTGKTRLALEFKAWVESQGRQTAFASCYPSARSLSYIPVIAWLKSVPMPKLCPIARSELSRLLPDLLEQDPDLPEPRPIQENWQLNRWYEAIKLMLSASEPLLLILDDIQWSDKETLQVLSYILLSDSRLLVVATMRTDDSLSEAAEAFFSGLQIERKLTEIEVAPFFNKETKHLMAATAGNLLAKRKAAGIKN